MADNDFYFNVGGKMIPFDADSFNLVVCHYGLSEPEIDSCRMGYCSYPEASHRIYRSMANQILMAYAQGVSKRA